MDDSKEKVTKQKNSKDKTVSIEKALRNGHYKQVCEKHGYNAVIRTILDNLLDLSKPVFPSECLGTVTLTKDLDHSDVIDCNVYSYARTMGTHDRSLDFSKRIMEHLRLYTLRPNGNYPIETYTPNILRAVSFLLATRPDGNERKIFVRRILAPILDAYLTKRSHKRLRISDDLVIAAVKSATFLALFMTDDIGSISLIINLIADILLCLKIRHDVKFDILKNVVALTSLDYEFEDHEKIQDYFTRANRGEAVALLSKLKSNDKHVVVNDSTIIFAHDSSDIQENRALRLRCIDNFAIKYIQEVLGPLYSKLITHQRTKKGQFIKFVNSILSNSKYNIPCSEPEVELDQTIIKKKKKERKSKEILKFALM